jgi:hypothetical protein
VASSAVAEEAGPQSRLDAGAYQAIYDKWFK